jgi:superfamily I DNA and/or RNA helicase
LTRAKHGLIIIGDHESLITDDNWKNMIKMIKDEGVYVEGINNAITRIESLIESQNK